MAARTYDDEREIKARDCYDDDDDDDDGDCVRAPAEAVVRTREERFV